MLGTPGKILRKLSASATCCIFEPGSVMAMKRLPTSVLADFFLHALEEILLEDVGLEGAAGFAGDDEKVLLEIELGFCRALICAGSVESRTCSSGKPSILPKVMRRTSGHRLEPPMPSKRMCLKLGFFYFGGKML